MKIQRTIAIICVISIQQMLLSCKNDSERIQDVKVKIENTKLEVKDIVQFKFNFPDTVYINKIYNGKIKYKGILDTITTTFNLDNDNPKKRYIIYRFMITNKIDYKIKQLSKMRLDTIDAIDVNTIPLRNIKFAKLGTYYIDGIINDNANMPVKIKGKNGEAMGRSITKKARATHKVVVIQQNYNSARL